MEMSVPSFILKSLAKWEGTKTLWQPIETDQKSGTTILSKNMAEKVGKEGLSSSTEEFSSFRTANYSKMAVSLLLAAQTLLLWQQRVAVLKQLALTSEL